MKLLYLQVFYTFKIHSCQAILIILLYVLLNLYPLFCDILHFWQRRPKKLQFIPKFFSWTKMYLLWVPGRFVNLHVGVHNHCQNKLLLVSPLVGYSRQVWLLGCLKPWHEPMNTRTHLGYIRGLPGKEAFFQRLYHSSIVQHTKRIQSRPYPNGFVIHV